jgi:glycosyltransferase involved in cell wall biosynthesis
MKTGEASRRLSTLIEVLGLRIDQDSDRGEVIAALSGRPTFQAIWATLAVLKAGYPTMSDVRNTRNSLRIRGAELVVHELLKHGGGPARAEFEVIENAVIVDVFHTAATELATGIQRVVRETVRRWAARDDLVLATWSADRGSLRRLTKSEKATALHGEKPRAMSLTASMPIIIPVGGTYIMPELGAEYWRTARVATIAECAVMSTGMIGHDCVPLTSAETTGPGMPAAFSRYLSAAARMGRISVTSPASLAEYRGWCDMLPGVGLRGPNIAMHTLASSVKRPAQSTLDQFSRKYADSENPLVVVVGSHEPRKNHLAILRAAEELWQKGERFTLLFIGGHSWRNDLFKSRLVELRSMGYPVETAFAVTDDELYSAYSLAWFTIYPSLNEGFGLPVSESLLLGTPAITSNFGSMAEIGRGHGALLVDPRSAIDMAVAMSRLLKDHALHRSLSLEADAYRAKSWDTYASETWGYLTGFGASRP